nr:L-rhamnose-binding lectin CSL3-like [Misgurnus anguillicaudatus]
MSCPYNEKATICSTISTFNMLHRELTFIPLLMLLCQHGAALQQLQHITCEGTKANITCEPGIISVVSSNYGRTSTEVCRGSFDDSALSDVNCLHDTLDDVSTKCNGKQTCSFDVNNNVYTDPCGGIYKYLDVHYFCLKAKKPLDCGNNGCDVTTICQFEKKEISCNGGEFSVQYAYYGRIDSQICPHSNSSLTSSVCYSDQTSVVKLLCDGKRTCNLYVSSLIYLDLCPQKYKYLAVIYTCKQGSQPS